MKNVVLLQRETMYIHSSQPRIYVVRKRFHKFWFLVLEAPHAREGSLFFVEFYIIKFKKILYLRRKLNLLHYDKH